MRGSHSKPSTTLRRTTCIFVIITTMFACLNARKESTKPSILASPVGFVFSLFFIIYCITYFSNFWTDLNFYKGLFCYLFVPNFCNLHDEYSHKLKHRVDFSSTGSKWSNLACRLHKQIIVNSNHDTFLLTRSTCYHLKLELHVCIRVWF